MHAWEFPRIEKSLREIHKATGIVGLDLFIPERIPPLHDLTQQHTLEHYLKVYSIVVSSPVARREILERDGQGIVLDAIFDPYSPCTKEAIEVAREILKKKEKSSV